MSTTLALFWNLSSGNKNERLDASVKLVGALEQFQAAFVSKQVVPHDSEGCDEEDEPTRKDELDSLNAQDVSYSVRRLIRGLGSPRESSRLGFAVALTELISRLNTVTCAQITKLVLDNSQIQGSSSGQEERDMLFARLFGFTSIIQSGLLVRTTPLIASPSTSVMASDLASYETIISQLLVLGDKKSWLRESAWWTIGLAVDAVNRSDVPWKEQAIRIVSDKAINVDIPWTPEKVAIALQLSSLYPEMDWRERLAPTFKHGQLLHTGNLVTLGRILRESDDSVSETAPKGTKHVSLSGTWKAQTHYVWDMLLDRVLSPNGQSGAQYASLQEFFRIVVDESLFSSSASSERKYWGFQIFQKALPRAKEADIPFLFTPNFMRCWINHLSKKDRYLHQITKQVADDVCAFAQKNSTIGFTLVLQLTGANGTHLFDRITKTKTVESIIASMDAPEIMRFIEHLFSRMNDNGSDLDTKTLAAQRIWIADQVSALVRNGAIPKDDVWVSMILDWLTLHGLFIVIKKADKSRYQGLRAVPKPECSPQFQEYCRTRLLRCLADLTGQANGGKDAAKGLGQVENTSNKDSWTSKVLSTIFSLENDTKHVRPIKAIDNSQRIAKEKANFALELARGAGEDRYLESKGAELVLQAILLNKYLSANEAGDHDSYSDSLEMCVDAITQMFTPKPKESNKSRKSGVVVSTDSADSSDVPPVDILVDLLIGFLETSNGYMRASANQAFTLLAKCITASALDLVITQLERRDPVAEEDEDEDREDVEMDGDSVTSGVESTQGTEVEDSESTEDDDDDGEDEDDDEDEDEDPELRLKLEEALGIPGASSNNVSGAESEEELMDDEQMMAIDEQLAEIFRAKAGSKKKNTSAQREATYFKNRVLDFVDIYLRVQASNPLSIRLVLPLVDIVTGTGTDERQLADKATGIIRSRLGKAKELPSMLDIDEVSKGLEKLHIRARHTHNSDALTTLCFASIYLSRILFAAGSQGRAAVLTAYRASLIDFATRKASTLHVNFILELVKRHAIELWDLRTTVVEVLPQAVNAYRRVQVLTLMQPFISRLFGEGAHKAEVVAFVPSFRDAVLSVLSNIDDEGGLTAAQMKEVFKLISQAARQTKHNCTAAELESMWAPPKWEELGAKLASSERFKDSKALHAACTQLAQIRREGDKPNGHPVMKAKKSPDVAQKAAGQEKQSGKRKAESAKENEGGKKKKTKTR